MTRVARISPMKFRGREGMLLQTPYDEVFLGRLKAMIPQRADKWWNEHRKGWWVAEAHVELVTFLVRECFGTVTIVGLDGRKVTLTPAGETLTQEELQL